MTDQTYVERPKVSVAIITYNHECFLADAIDSVLKQRCDLPFEIVIGEDCSTDRTPEIAKEYGKRYPDIVRPLIREKNIGRGGRNLEATIRECRGEYIALLEGDDFWIDDQKMQMQSNFLDAHPEYSACYSRTISANEEGVITSVRLKREPDCDFELVDVLRGARGATIDTRSVMFRHEAFPGFPAWVTKQKMGDKPLTVLLAMSGKLRCFGQPVAAHRYHGGGCWTAVSPTRQILFVVRYLKALHKWVPEDYQHLVEDQLYINRIQLGMWLWSNGQRRRALAVWSSTKKRHQSHSMLRFAKIGAKFCKTSLKRRVAATIRRIRKKNTATPG